MLIVLAAPVSAGAAPSGTTITGSPPLETSSTSATFTFTATDNDVPLGDLTFECQLDGGSFAACSSPESLTGLSEGVHTFDVRAVDSVGGPDPTPATYTWLIDLTAPDITITTPANKQHLTLHGPLTPVFSCTDPPAGSPTPGASGVATCTSSATDLETLGPHLFTVNSTDDVGNAATPVSHAYVIDPPRYADFLLADNPLAYYRLNEAIGADPMGDASSNGRNGEFKNGIALRREAAIACQRRPDPPRACELAADPQDWSASFPARDGYGYVNGISAPTSAYTLEAWVRPRTGTDMSIVGHGGAGQLFIKDGRLALRQTQDTVLGAGPVLTPGSWWHVAATWDGTNTRLYVNGVQVAHSTSANKRPSGQATFYVGYGDQAPWFHGELDEVAYYSSALSQHAFEDRYKIGTAADLPSLGTLSGAGNTNTAKPRNIPVHPARDGLYSHQSTKNPVVEFACSDPDGAGDIATCTMTIDGTPTSNGAALPVTVGDHTVVIEATDNGGNTFSETYTYTVKGFSSIIGHDSPAAYYRLGDAAGASVMQAQFGPNGEYKNRQNSGPVGIAGDGDTARRFEGDGGYGYANGIAAPRHHSTLEAFVRPDDGRNQSIAGHGDAGELFIQDGTFRFRHMFTTVDSGVTATPLVWRQVVGRWDGVHASIWVDGVLRASAEATRRPSSQSTFYVGYGELAPWFAGAIDEVAYYAKALTDARILQHYLADPPPGPGRGQSAPQHSQTVPDRPAQRTKRGKKRRVPRACRRHSGRKRRACVKRARAVSKCKRAARRKTARSARKRSYRRCARRANRKYKRALRR